MYKKFAYIYDKLMDDFDYELWSNYIEDIFEKKELEPKDILVMACGTGNLSEKLLQKGYNLTCFDLSSDMLAVADQKLNKYKDVKLLQQNMIEFNIGKKFDSVLAICDSINYILELEELIKTFKNVYNHLEDGGVFIFDINSHYKINHILKDNIFIEDREDVFYTWENYYDDETDICQYYLNFFVSENNGETYERFIEVHYEKAWTIKEIEEALNLAGFKHWDIYREWTFKEMSHDVENNDAERIHFAVSK